MRKIALLAVNTFRESVRSKVPLAFFFCAISLMLISALFSATTIGDRIQLLKDFGLASVSLTTVTFVVIAGSSLLAKELQRRTIFNILARPVPRYEFLLGKFFGLFFTSILLICIMGAALLALLYCFNGAIDLSVMEAYGFMILELAIVCATAIFFSSIVVTPSLNGLFTFGAFLAGRSVEYLANFSQDTDIPSILRYIAHILYAVLPHLNRLYVANDTVYGISLTLRYFGWAALYACGYSALLLALAAVAFERKNFS